MSAEEYEQRFNCIVCLCPKLCMVYGSCQHRVCADCLYDEKNNRRPSMKACPTCQRDDAFPPLRPNIPDDTLAIQRCLGIIVCTNTGCHMELWEWELESHLRSCPSRLKTPDTKPCRVSISSHPSSNILPQRTRNGQEKPEGRRVTRSSTFSGRVRPQVSRRLSARLVLTPVRVNNSTN